VPSGECGLVALPATGGLRETVAMAVDRAAHTATALPDGRVLVAGGLLEKGSATSPGRADVKSWRS
jgi:hypothetical protein